MAKQTINLGTAPTGAGGDTNRAAFAKAQANFDEIYTSGLIERGSNAKGGYTKFPDGTLITWGKQVIDGTVPAGQSVKWLGGTIENQPYPFVGTPISDVSYSMMTATAGGGIPIYTMKQSYSSRDETVHVGVNMGTTPASSHPMLTYGTQAAASCVVVFTSTGRWK